MRWVFRLCHISMQPAGVQPYRRCRSCCMGCLRCSFLGQGTGRTAHGCAASGPTARCCLGDMRGTHSLHQPSNPLGVSAHNCGWQRLKNHACDCCTPQAGLPADLDKLLGAGLAEFVERGSNDLVRSLVPHLPCKPRCTLIPAAMLSLW